MVKRSFSVKSKQLLLLISLLGASHGFGQDTNTKSKAPTATTTTAKADDEGGWKYLGERMWFQVKKRMNMTTEEEEAAEEKKKGKNLRLKILGVEVAKPNTKK